MTPPRASDIAAMLSRRGPSMPPDVRRARRELQMRFHSLSFDPALHAYSVRMESGAERALPCVSSVVARYAAPTDWDAVAGRVAERDGRRREDVLAEWEYRRLAAAEAGTAVHRYAEAWFHFAQGGPESVADADMASRLRGGWLLPRSAKEEAVCAFWAGMLAAGAWPVAAEQRLHSLWLRPRLAEDYAGTADLLVATQEAGRPLEFALYDWKTNASLEDAWARSHGRRMLPPFASLADEPLGRYAVQQSLYSLALRSVGVEVSRRALVWLKGDGSYEVVPVPDVEAQCVEAMGLKR